MRDIFSYELARLQLSAFLKVEEVKPSLTAEELLAKYREWCDWLHPEWLGITDDGRIMIDVQSPEVTIPHEYARFKRLLDERRRNQTAL